MELNQETLTLLSGPSGMVSVVVGYYILKSKVERIEKDLYEQSKRFVSMELFQASIQPLRDDIHHIRLDLRELLSSIQDHKTK